MPLNDEEIAAIQKRNEERKQLKQATSEGPWEYDSWAFIHQSETIPRHRRFGIAVRPMTWFDSLGKRIDEGLPKDRKMVQQGYYDAEYIAKARDDGAERDIDALLDEVQRLRKNRK